MDPSLIDDSSIQELFFLMNHFFSLEPANPSSFKICKTFFHYRHKMFRWDNQRNEYFYWWYSCTLDISDAAPWKFQKPRYILCPVWLLKCLDKEGCVTTRMLSSETITTLLVYSSSLSSLLHHVNITRWLSTRYKAVTGKDLPPTW